MWQDIHYQSLKPALNAQSGIYPAYEGTFSPSNFKAGTLSDKHKGQILVLGTMLLLVPSSFACSSCASHTETHVEAGKQPSN